MMHDSVFMLELTDLRLLDDGGNRDSTETVV